MSHCLIVMLCIFELYPCWALIWYKFEVWHATTCAKINLGPYLQDEMILMERKKGGWAKKEWIPWHGGSQNREQKNPNKDNSQHAMNAMQRAALPSVNFILPPGPRPNVRGQCIAIPSPKSNGPWPLMPRGRHAAAGRFLYWRKSEIINRKFEKKWFWRFSVARSEKKKGKKIARFVY